MFGHPYDCAIRKYPANCQYCGRFLIYWECAHGSKVFFEPPNGGDHKNRCPAMLAPSGGATPPKPDGRTARGTLESVSFGVQPDDYGVMHGMKRVGPGVAELRRSLEEMPEQSGRDTVAMQPYGGESETIAGEVSDMFEIDLAARFGIKSNSIGAIALGKTFHGLRAAQITILVDDFLNDPDAVDKMSYTAWCPSGEVPRGLAKRAFAIAEISPREFPTIGRRWLVERIEEENPFGA